MENIVTPMVKLEKKSQHLFLPTGTGFPLLFKRFKSWALGSKRSEVFRNYFPSIACNYAHGTSCNCGTLNPGWREELEAVAYEDNYGIK